MPAAEEQHGGQRGDHDDADVLGEQEEREPQAGVLGHVAEHQLGVGDRHVERRPPDLGQPGDEEDQHRRAAARAATTAASASTMPGRLSVPAAIATLAAASTNGSS